MWIRVLNVLIFIIQGSRGKYIPKELSLAELCWKKLVELRASGQNGCEI